MARIVDGPFVHAQSGEINRQRRFPDVASSRFRSTVRGSSYGSLGQGKFHLTWVWPFYIAATAGHCVRLDGMFACIDHASSSVLSSSPARQHRGLVVFPSSSHTEYRRWSEIYSTDPDTIMKGQGFRVSCSTSSALFHVLVRSLHAGAM